MTLGRAFVGNRALLRAQLSFGAAFTAEWSFSVAIGLVAFAHGGAIAVGLVGLTTIDASVAVRTDDIMLLRRVPMLRPLPVPVIEQLAHSLHRTPLRPGDAVFEAGDTGDSFYVVAAGTVNVLHGDQSVRTMGQGQGFGEIALLGNTTRTMTVRAVDEVQLCGISRSDFLTAITSISAARTAAEDAKSAHVAHAPGRVSPVNPA